MRSHSVRPPCDYVERYTITRACLSWQTAKLVGVCESPQIGPHGPPRSIDRGGGPCASPCASWWTARTPPSNVHPNHLASSRPVAPRRVPTPQKKRCCLTVTPEDCRSHGACSSTAYHN